MILRGDLSTRRCHHLAALYPLLALLGGVTVFYPNAAPCFVVRAPGIGVILRIYLPHFDLGAFEEPVPCSLDGNTLVCCVFNPQMPRCIQYLRDVGICLLYLF